MAIAQLVAKRFTETEACGVIGLKRETWATYKQRHAETIEHIFSQSKTNQLVGHINQIEKHGDKDWRAARELLAIKDSRFARDGGGNNVVVTVNNELSIGAIDAAYRVVVGDAGTTSQLDNAQTLQLANTPTPEPTNDATTANV